jgi:hypothetical protein
MERVRRADDHDDDPELIGQKLEQIEGAALFAQAAGKEMVNFIGARLGYMAAGVSGRRVTSINDNALVTAASGTHSAKEQLSALVRRNIEIVCRVTNYVDSDRDIRFVLAESCPSCKLFSRHSFVSTAG